MVYAELGKGLKSEVGSVDIEFYQRIENQSEFMRIAAPKGALGHGFASGGGGVGVGDGRAPRCTFPSVCYTLAGKKNSPKNEQAQRQS
jgi:hypothetical protein